MMELDQNVKDGPSSTCPNCDIIGRKLEKFKADIEEQLKTTEIALQNIRKIMSDTKDGRPSAVDNELIETNDWHTNGTGTHTPDLSVNGVHSSCTSEASSNNGNEQHEDLQLNLSESNENKRKSDDSSAFNNETDTKRFKTTKEKRQQFMFELKSLPLRFTYNIAKKTYIHSINSHFDLTLDDLNECLKEANEFPCKSFSFSFFADTNLDEPEFEEFISTHGNNIEHFEVTLSTLGKPNIKAFQRLFLEKMSNLESLCIWNLPYENSKEEASASSVANTEDNEWNISSSLQLPKLKTVKILKAIENSPYDEFHHGHYQFRNLMNDVVVGILKAAVNLESYESQFDLYQDVHCIMTLIEANKVKVIQPLKINFNPENLSLYDRLATLTGVKLSQIEFTRFYSHDNNREEQNSQKINHVLAVAICRILNNCCQDTLEQITLKTSCYEVPPEVKWPELSCVTNLIMDPLKVVQSREQSHLIDHPDLFTIVKIPALRSVSLISSVFDNISFRNSLFIKVKHPCDDALLFCLKELAQNFPNLEHLSCQKVDKFSDIGPVLWSFKGLKSLDLELCIDKKLSRGSSSAVDATFTGFSVATCMNLQWKLKDNIKLPCPSRVNPSIMDLKDLHDLKIKFSPKDRHAYFENDFSFRCKNCSFVYAFDLMPQLTVKVLKHEEI